MAKQSQFKVAPNGEKFGVYYRHVHKHGDRSFTNWIQCAELFSDRGEAEALAKRAPAVTAQALPQDGMRQTVRISCGQFTNSTTFSLV